MNGYISTIAISTEHQQVEPKCSLVESKFNQIKPTHCYKSMNRPSSLIKYKNVLFGDKSVLQSYKNQLQKFKTI